MTGYADMKAMLANVGMTLEILTPDQLAAAMCEIEFPRCPTRAEGDQPHCPVCSGIAGETGIVW